MRKTWNVTLPMISPVIFYTLIINIIGYFQYFTEAWVLTATRDGAAGGPLNSMLFYAMYLYQTAFQLFKMGYASAQAWVLFAIVLVATGATVPLLRVGLLSFGGISHGCRIADTYR